ncbi:MAG TPA: OmpH family outer membrane protein, partial [Paracoccus sp. (in: a-proteobacteria)]|nr:OmpH family outer membrane protein [Paracoccus sp. (in: a-proteobacteria)]
MRTAAVIVLGLLAAAGTAGAQDARPAPADSPTAGQALRQAVLTVDQEALYIESAWGRRAQVELARMSQQVSADNDRIFAELSAAEEELTQARATLSAEEFRARASAFDERVTQVRRERDAAARAIGLAAERDRALFFQAAVP